MDSITKLTKALFAEVDRLGELDLEDADRVGAELSRAKVLEGMAEAITANNAMAIKVAKLMVDNEVAATDVRGLLGE